jgi:hypothetical protein
MRDDMAFGRLGPKDQYRLLKAFFEDGVEIQQRENGRWTDIAEPSFSSGELYRIKPPTYWIQIESPVTKEVRRGTVEVDAEGFPILFTFKPEARQK